MSVRAMTLRLPSEQAALLAVLARVSGRSVSEEVRTAVAAYIVARKTDPEFALRAQRMADEWAAFANSCLTGRPSSE